MRVYTYGSPVLRKKGQKVKNIDKKLEKIIKEMFFTMQHTKPQGVGLAATQVGVPLLFFVYKIENEEGVVINPEILERKGKNLFEEGCLSVPGVYAKVERPEIIIVRYYDTNGKKHEEEVKDFKARVFQHEIDHLNGVIFTDYVTNIDDFFVEEGYTLPEGIIRRFMKK